MRDVDDIQITLTMEELKLLTDVLYCCGEPEFLSVVLDVDPDFASTLFKKLENSRREAFEAAKHRLGAAIR